MIGDDSKCPSWGNALLQRASENLAVERGQELNPLPCWRLMLGLCRARGADVYQAVVAVGKQYVGLVRCALGSTSYRRFIVYRFPFIADGHVGAGREPHDLVAFALEVGGALLFGRDLVIFVMLEAVDCDGEVGYGHVLVYRSDSMPAGRHRLTINEVLMSRVGRKVLQMQTHFSLGVFLARIGLPVGSWNARVVQFRMPHKNEFVSGISDGLILGCVASACMRSTESSDCALLSQEEFKPFLGEEDEVVDEGVVAGEALVLHCLEDLGDICLIRKEMGRLSKFLEKKFNSARACCCDPDGSGSLLSAVECDEGSAGRTGEIEVDDWHEGIGGGSRGRWRGRCGCFCGGCWARSRSGFTGPTTATSSRGPTWRREAAEQFSFTMGLVALP